MAENATFTVKGSLFIGGVMHYPDQSAQAHTSGKYNELAIEGHVVVASGGKIDVMGRVTGKGDIVVQSGGALYQPFMILDYSGGTNTQAMFGNGLTPFKMYAMVNIQCEGGYTVEYGGALYGHASLYFWGGVTTIDQPFITYEGATGELATALLILKEGAKATAVYRDGHARVEMGNAHNAQDVGKTTITVEGGAIAGYMSFPLGIDTSSVYFSLPYNYELVLKANAQGAGDYSVANYFKLMPGAVVTVEEGATLSVKSGKGLYVHDSFFGPNVSHRAYPTGEQLTAAGYNSYASLIVNGTLNIEDNSEFLGTVQTASASGRIVVGSGVTLQKALFDGTSTQYTCNYTEYTLTAQVWDKVHACLTPLEAGRTYESAYAAGDTFEINGIEFKYETNTGAHNSDVHTLASLTAASASGLKGSWKVVHGEHVYDWSSLSGDEGTFNGEKFKELSRGCQELGCTEAEKKILLNMENFAISATYRGTAFAESDLLELFYAYFFGDAKPEYFSASVTITGGPIQNAAEYQDVVITLTNGYFNDLETTEKSVLFTVNKFDVANLSSEALASSLENLVYNGTAQTPELALTAEGLQGEVTVSTNWENNVNAGNNSARVTVTGVGTNFEGEISATFSIAKANLVVTAEDKTAIYGEADKPLTYKAAGLQGEDTVAVLKEVNIVRVAGTNAGTYDITVSALADNYEIEFVKGTYTIEKAALTVTIDSQSQIYGENLKNLTMQLSGDIAGEAALIKEAITLTTSATQWAIIGAYEITAEYDDSVGVLANYAVQVANSGEKIYTVTEKPIEDVLFTVTATYSYDRNKKEPTVSEISAVLSGYEGDHAVTFTVGDYQNNTNAGTASLVVTATGNFTGSKTVEFVIAQATIDSVTVESTHVYDGSVYVPELTVKAGEVTLKSGEYAVGYSSEVKNAGTYTLTVVSISDNFANVAERVSATFTVERRDIAGAEVAVAGNYTYNGSAHTLQAENVTVTVDGLNATFVIKADGYLNNINATTEECLATVTVEGTENFTGTAVGNFAIAKKEITIKPNDAAIIYGDPDKELTYRVLADGLVAGEKQEEVLTVALSRAVGKTVGNYDIKVDEATAANYAIKTETGTYTISKKTVNAVINDQSVTYNGKEQAATSIYGTDWTLLGALAYEDTYDALNVVLSASGKDVNANGYPIVGTANAANYEVVFTEGTLTIGKATVTVTANAADSPVGEALSELTFAVTGYFDDIAAFRDAIAVSVDENAKSGTAGQTFTITVAFKEGITAEDYSNYEVLFRSGIYTITDAVFKGVAFTSATETYDGQAHTLAVTGLDLENTHKGAKVAYTMSGEPFTGATDAGEYEVTATVTLGSYNPLVLTAKLTVEKRVISVTVADRTSVYGAALSELIFTCENAVVGEEETVGKAVHLTTNATATSVVSGTYTVRANFDELDNYDFTVTNEGGVANYTITAKPITVTIAKQAWATYTGKEQSAHSTVDDWTVEEGALVGQDNKSGLGILLTVSGTDAGSYTISGSSSNENYTVAFEGGENAFVIARKSIAAAEIGGLDGEFIYKETQWAPEITVTLAGFDAALNLTAEYTVAYGENVTVADGGVVIITGAGNFEGTVERTFTILPKSIEDVVITVTNPELIVYKAEQWRPEFTTHLDGYHLNDLTAQYGANVNAGENAGSVTVTGVENFTGSKTVYFDVKAREITVTVGVQEVIYNQKEQAASSAQNFWTVENLAGNDGADVLNVKLTATAENAGSYDVTAAWSNENYIVTFAGDGLIADGNTIKGAFIVKAAALTSATLTSSHVYNGKAQTAAYTVKAGALTVPEADYQIEYGSDRVSAGTVNVTIISASENYTGEIKTVFDIAKKAINVKLNAQSFEYSGKVPVLDNAAYTVDVDELCVRNGVKDDLGIVITTDANKDFGEYALTAIASNTDYAVAFDASEKLTITKKNIVVKADHITATYGDKQAAFTYTAEGLVEGDTPDMLTVNLRADRTIKEVGSYKVSGNGYATNYTFTVVEGMYTVEPKEITVTILNQSHLYDGKEPVVTQEQGTAWTTKEGAIIAGDNLHVVLSKTAGVDVKEGGYAITGTYNNHNYAVTFVDGVYTITARPLTIEIEDQSAVYHYEHGYLLNGEKWHVIANDGNLAIGETRETLNVTLITDELTDAGEYAITGTWDNGNYAITFVGNYENEGDDASGRAGIFTIQKQDVTDDAIFIMGVENEDSTSEGMRTVRTTYSGGDLVLFCKATIFEGVASRELHVAISPATITAIGNYGVTVDVEEPNYSGSTTFTVIVTDANGYTQKLQDTLKELEELAADLNAEALTIADFEMLKKINGLLSSLDDTEREVAQSDLEQYYALVNAWNDLANIDDIIETAETIANAPIIALFKTVTTLTALAALAYIATKGGIL